MFKTTKKKREERGRGGRDSGKGLSRAPTWNIVSQTDCTFSLKLDLNSKSCQTCAVIMLLTTTQNLACKTKLSCLHKSRNARGSAKICYFRFGANEGKKGATRKKLAHCILGPPSAMAASEGAKHVWSVKQKSAELPLRWHNWFFFFIPPRLQSRDDHSRYVQDTGCFPRQWK